MGYMVRSPLLPLRRALLALTLAFSLAVGGPPVQAQEPTPSPTVTKNEGMTLAEKAGLAALVYVLAGTTASAVKQMLFEITDPTLEWKLQRELSLLPKKVLFISLSNESDSLYEWTQIKFREKYGEGGAHRFVHAKTFDELKLVLASLPQDRSFDRIEIAGHGSPGSLSIGEESSRTFYSRIRELKQFTLAQKNAELVFYSCSLAVQSGAGYGRYFLEEFGEALLPRGGKVLGTTKDIIVLKFDGSARRMLFRALRTVLNGTRKPVRLAGQIAVSTLVRLDFDDLNLRAVVRDSVKSFYSSVVHDVVKVTVPDPGMTDAERLACIAGALSF